MAETIQLDKIASVVCRIHFPRTVSITSDMESRSGNTVVVRVLPEGALTDIETWIENGALAEE